MLAVRDDVVVLALNAQEMFPELVPLAPDVIESQLLPDVTCTVHGMSPYPVLEMLNVVVPASFATFWMVGSTEMTQPLSANNI
jgi:hypothetical protein